MSDASNAAQAEYWNETAGPTWVELQDQLDRMIEPMGLAGLAALAPALGEAILDIGCGCGRTTFQIAEAVGTSGMVVGADISATMLAEARARAIPPTAAHPQFREVDAQTGDLGRAKFDAAFSRFGVMFFADPVAAFGNIRSALKSGGRLIFVCWRSLAENPWMRVPLEAALPLLPPLPPPDPTAPGPYALADPARVRQILEAAGFHSLEIVPFDADVGGDDLDGSVALTFRIGPLAAALREHPQHRAEVTDAVRQALSAYVTSEGVMMPGGVWLVTTRAN
ncbi:MAG TPA: class I SAM-dependent methyltransferase [Caulobacteraceae bacterium]